MLTSPCGCRIHVHVLVLYMYTCTVQIFVFFEDAHLSTKLKYSKKKKQYLDVRHMGINGTQSCSACMQTAMRWMQN